MYIWEVIKDAHFVNIDLAKRNMKVDGKTIIKEGVIQDGYELIRLLMPRDMVLAELETYYVNYKYSIPSKRSDSRYFKGLAMEDIPDEYIPFAEGRNQAKAKLEWYVLERLLTGELTWDNNEMGGTWFWQSKREPELVLLIDWIEGK